MLRALQRPKNLTAAFQATASKPEDGACAQDLALVVSEHSPSIKFR